jgi:hypothetical protein
MARPRHSFDPRRKPERGTYELEPDCPLSRGLRGLYLFNEGAGTSLGEASGRVRGVAVNSPSWRAGRFGSEMLFNKASDQYVNLGNPAALQITGPITLAARYRLTSVPAASGNSYQLIAKDKDTGGRAYVLDVNRDNTLSLAGARFYINGVGAANIAKEGRIPVAGDERFVVGQFDGTNSRLYLDGLLVASVAAGGTSINTATANVLIGRREYAGFTEPMDGSISYAGIWAGIIDAAWLTAEPHAMLRPAMRRSYSASTGGSTGEFVVSVTQADDSTASAAMVDVFAAVAVTQADDVAVSAVSIAVTAAFAATQDDDTTVSAVSVAVTVTVSVTQADDTTVSAAAVSISATVTVTQDDDVVASTFAASDGPSFYLGVTLDDDTAVSAVAVAVTASFAITQDDDLSAAGVQVLVSAVVGVAQADDVVVSVVVVSAPSAARSVFRSPVFGSAVFS